MTQNIASLLKKWPFYWFSNIIFFEQNLAKIEEIGDHF
jgi:hypothetical protein